MINTVLAVLGGLLLFASDQPLRNWPLQFVALVPWFTALLRARTAGGWLVWIGVSFGVSYVLPLVVVAGFQVPVLIAAGAALLQWTLAGSLAGRLLGSGDVRGALAAAAALTLVEITVWHAVPMFGTAQCFARPLSAAPAAVGFVAYTGVGGLVFALHAVQALLAVALRGPRRRMPLLVALGIAIVCGALAAQRWTRPSGPMLRVAAFGWHRSGSQGLDAMLAEAVQQRARLLVTPETGVFVGDREQALDGIGGLVTKHGLAAAIGVWYGPGNDNRIWFLGADGSLQAEYRKTHLVPWLEDYEAGDGTPALGGVDGIPFGGMICQDDNFTDVARTYGRMAVPLVAVPTNDWEDIREFHLENSLFRALENGYAVVRAASSGISALISPRGEVLARCDHVLQGQQMLCGDLPLGDGTVTLHARFGDWPMVGLCLLLLVEALRRR